MMQNAKNVFSIFLENESKEKKKTFTSRSSLINVTNALQILLRLCFATIYYKILYMYHKAVFFMYYVRIQEI